MKLATLDKLTWVLIFGGALALMLGTSTLSVDATIGWPILIGGAVMVAAGVLTIYLRSRITESED